MTALTTEGPAERGAPELLPCPFCGDDEILARCYPISGWRAQCDCCGASCEGKDWNRRATDPAVQALVAKAVAEAEARGMERALVVVNKARATVIHSANRNFIDGVAFGHDRSENAIRAEAATIRKGENP